MVSEPDLVDAERKSDVSRFGALLKALSVYLFLSFSYNNTVGNGVLFVLCAFLTKEFVQIDENKKVNEKY